MDLNDQYKNEFETFKLTVKNQNLINLKSNFDF